MDDVIEFVFKGILQFLGLIVRSLVFVAWEFCFERVGWYIGWPLLRLLTLNKYPKEDITSLDFTGQFTGNFVPVFGFIVLVLVGFGWLCLASPGYRSFWL
mgnify:CR=1 FL=1